MRGTLADRCQTLRGDGGRRAPVDVQLETSAIDLSVAQAFTTAVQDVQGTLQANVHFTGTLAEPRLDGSVRIAGGALTVAATETPFTGLEADVAMQDDRVDVPALRDCRQGRAQADGDRRRRRVAAPSARCKAMSICG